MSSRNKEKTDNKFATSPDLVEIIEIEPDSNQQKENSGGPYKILTYIFGGLFILSLLAIFYFAAYKNKKDVYKAVAIERERISNIEKEKSDMEEKLKSLNGENRELDRSLEDAFKNMADKDILISQLNKENETLKQIKDEVDKIESIGENLKKQKSEIEKSQIALKNVHNSISKTIEDKQLKNKKLTEGLK